MEFRNHGFIGIILIIDNRISTHFQLLIFKQWNLSPITFYPILGTDSLEITDKLNIEILLDRIVQIYPQEKLLDSSNRKEQLF